MRESFRQESGRGGTAIKPAPCLLETLQSQQLMRAKHDDQFGASEARQKWEEGAGMSVGS
jgi:hypothetical protein